MCFPILEKSRGYRLIFAIELVIVKDLERHIVPSHIPGQVRCPNSGRQGDGRLIVKFPTQKAIANPPFQKVLDSRTAIKVEIGDMKKSMNGMQLGTGTRVSVVSFRRRGQFPVDNSNATDGLFKGVVNAIVDGGTLDFAPWKIVKQNGEIVLQKDGHGIAIPNSRTKAIGIHPQHGLVRGQCGMRPQVPGPKFCLPIVGNATRTLGPPRQILGIGDIAPLEKFLPSKGGQGGNFVVQGTAIVHHDREFGGCHQGLSRGNLCGIQRFGGKDNNIVQDAMVVGLMQQTQGLVQQDEVLRSMNFGGNHDTGMAFKFSKL